MILEFGNRLRTCNTYQTVALKRTSVSQDQGDFTLELTTSAATLAGVHARS
jgi:hypothetical protein